MAGSYAIYDGVAGSGGGGGGSGANVHLSNLSSPTAINENLIFNGTHSIQTSSGHLSFITDSIDYFSLIHFDPALLDNYWALPTPSLMIDSLLNNTSANAFIFGSTDVSTDTPTTHIGLQSGAILTAPSGNQNTGGVYINSGAILDVTSSGGTGQIFIQTGNNSGTGVSNGIDLVSGNSVGDSGYINLTTGTSTSGTVGSITLSSNSTTIISRTTGTPLIIQGASPSSTYLEIYDPNIGPIWSIDSDGTLHNGGNGSGSYGLDMGGSHLLANGGIHLAGNTIDMGTGPITNLVDPTNPQDAATKIYVDQKRSLIGIRYNDASATVTSSASPIAFANKSWDTNSSYSGSTFTTPYAGVYEVNYSILLANSFLVGDQTTGFIYVNNSLYTRSQTFVMGSTSDLFVMQTDQCSLAQGDTVVIQIASSRAGTTVAGNGTYNYLNITFMGTV